jgi:hypothetical protein
VEVKQVKVRRSLVGERFGRLVVTAQAEDYVNPKGVRHARWKCRCDCTAIVTVRGSSLRSFHTTSCGCWGRESSARRIAEHNTKHGHAIWRDGKQVRSGAYVSWRSMITRCEDANHNSFPAYGGRPGNPIRICEGMRTFEGFLSVMGERPEGMSIDRINNDLGYHCGGCGHCAAEGWARNVRWATYSQQRRNQRPRSQWRQRSDLRVAA